MPILKILIYSQMSQKWSKKMRIFIDDGSTTQMMWEQDGETRTHISPNSFKRGMVSNIWRWQAV